MYVLFDLKFTQECMHCLERSQPPQGKEVMPNCVCNPDPRVSQPHVLEGFVRLKVSKF